MFTLKQIGKICNGKIISGTPNQCVSGISIDSRTVQAGELFIALRGDRYDAHQFIPDVWTAGADCVLAEQKPDKVNGPLIIVGDTLQAFHQLARFYRNQFYIPVVAVTGSVGKTTTKECIGVALSHVFQTRVGYGNWNNHIGVPLNLFTLSESDEAMVLEMGANHPGEIRQLAKTAQPTVGVITGVRPVHLEGFGSLDVVYRAKLELAEYIDRASGTLIVNADDPELMRRLKAFQRVRMITFGMNRQCDFYLSQLVSNGDVICFQVNESIVFRLRGYGVFNALNALAAVATAAHFKIDLAALSQSWTALPVIEGRFQCRQLQGMDVTVVNDAYNANPYSFLASLDAFCGMVGDRRKIVVAGDMLEMGSKAQFYHEKLGEILALHEIDYVLGIGPLSTHVVMFYEKHRPKGHAIHFDDVMTAVRYLADQLTPEDAILIKGSHGIHLESFDQMLEQALDQKPVIV